MRVKNYSLASGAMLAALLLSVAPGSFGQTGNAPTGVISGTVTANKGLVRAVRVKASDTVRKISYIVFTKNGGYQVFNLLPGTYQVSALQDGFDSTKVTVELKPGETKTADLALTDKGVASNVELVDLDTLYPPGPGRDVLFNECAGCHSLEHIPWHKMAPRDEAGWKLAVDRMFIPREPREIPIVSPDEISAEKREAMVKYFAANFGIGSKRRDLKLDDLPLDENVLSQARWVQYDMPPPGKAASGRDVSRRGSHDIYPSAVSQAVWMVDTAMSSILKMDLVNLNYPDRFQEWKLAGRTALSVVPHGIIESKGRVYWTELDNSSVGELDPKTGEHHQYRTPSKSAPHTLRADSQGNIWYSSLYDASRIGMLDAKTKQITEWTPAPQYKNVHYYGMTVDKQDRVWAVGMTAHIIVGYEPKTKKWTTYPTPTQPSGPRRPSVAPDGMIWFSENIADRIGMLDPATGKITEYKSPFRHGGEYECFADAQGNIWVTLRAYETLTKFDPKTKQYTHYPHPVPKGGGRIPKVETDAKGNVWGALGATLLTLQPKGNVPARQ